MASKPAIAPHVEMSAEEHRGLGKRFVRWVQDDAPAWLMSLVFHFSVLIVIALVLGRSITKRATNEVSTFETTAPEKAAEEPVERFELQDAPVDPTELTTESLTARGPIRSRSPRPCSGW